MKAWFCLVCLGMMALAAPPRSYGAEVSGITINDYGIFELTLTSARPAPQTSQGVAKDVKKAVLKKQTDRIPAVKGSEFGVLFSITGSPPQALVTITTRLLTPGLQAPSAQGVRYVEEWENQHPIGTKNEYKGFGFEHDWELVPGVWTIQLFHRGRKLAEKSFTVYKP